MGGGIEQFQPKIPRTLRDAIERVRPQSDPKKYLSNCPNDSLPDRAWRHFWFKYILHGDALAGWSKDPSGNYIVNRTSSEVLRSDGRGKKLVFVGRSDSVKNKLVNDLNSESISEADADEALVKNYFKRAHSYREDVDSGCEHLGFVERDGRLTDSGYKFVDACERFGTRMKACQGQFFSMLCYPKAHWGLSSITFTDFRRRDSRVTR